MAQTTTQITFKLEATFFEQLRVAAEDGSTSPNLFARQVVIAYLQRQENDAGRIERELLEIKNLVAGLPIATAATPAAVETQRLPNLAAELHQLRLDLATAVTAILVPLRPNDELSSITAWVEKNLLPRK
jgi:hypothetical protein